MEELPRVPQGEVPSYSALQTKMERERKYRIEKSRHRLAFIMAVAHGMVELSLRQESRGVRSAVRDDLKRRYGFRASRAMYA